MNCFLNCKASLFYDIKVKIRVKLPLSLIDMEHQVKEKKKGRNFNINMYFHNKSVALLCDSTTTVELAIQTLLDFIEANSSEHKMKMERDSSDFELLVSNSNEEHNYFSLRRERLLSSYKLSTPNVRISISLLIKFCSRINSICIINNQRKATIFIIMVVAQFLRS